MELRHLRYFIAVAETGSLTEAAERRLYTSQPSLSRQIRDLESHVGVKLLSRSVRGVELTPAGKAFLDHARLVLMHVDTAVETARRAAQPERKTFAIGFQTGHEMNWLPWAMQVLHHELKEIQVTVSSDYSPDLAEALARGRLDLAFLRVEPGYDLEYHVVDREPLVVLMPSDHRLTARSCVSAQALVGEIFIGGSNKAAVLRAVTEDYFRRSGLDIKLDHGVDNMAMAMSLVVHPRRGADARVRQEPAAAVGRQPTAGRRGTHDRDSRGLQQIEHLAGPRALRVAARRTGAPEPEAMMLRIT